MISSVVSPAHMYDGGVSVPGRSSDGGGGGMTLSQQQPPPGHQLSLSPSQIGDYSPASYHHYGYTPQQPQPQQRLLQSQTTPQPSVRPYYPATPTPTPEVLSMGSQPKQQSPLSSQQQPQQQTQTVRELTPNTPWTLGSADSSYAINLALFQKQQQLASLKDRQVSPKHGLNNEKQPSDSAESSEEHDENIDWKLQALQNNQSLFQDRLLQQPSAAVEATLAAACEVMTFDIAEMWLRTGLKTHQLTNSHLRPTALDESTRMDLVDVYYGEKSAERTHRLSPALCKRAKEANDVIWVSAQSERDAEALRCSISNVRTAVAVPICHEATNTNITIIFFSVRRVVVRPSSVEFLVHMALAAGVASVNSMEEMGYGERRQVDQESRRIDFEPALSTSRSDHGPHEPNDGMAIQQHRTANTSVTGAPLDLQWRQLQNVEYLTDGGSSWVHTAVLQGRPVVVKTLKPECQDIAVAINEIEAELAVHSRLDNGNIVRLIGAGSTSKNVRFLVLERLDGGTLAQMLGYDTRIRDRRRRFWKRKHFSFVDMLRIARSIAKAMVYCHEEAIPGCIVIHRDLKPDNIGFTLDGTVKVLDFGLAKIIENASVNAKDVYMMSGETGSLRYMAPEVAEGTPYNAAVDVYSFGIILWELNSGKKPFEGLTRETFYEQVVHGGERPPVRSKWPEPLCNLMTQCWDADMWNRPTFREILERIDEMLGKEMGGTGGGGPLRRRSSGSSSSSGKKPLIQKLSGMIDRHSTWF
ncbi:hypothetical protein ACA910_005863 [Epithemia clementina (nom. ined.)]